MYSSELVNCLVPSVPWALCFWKAGPDWTMLRVDGEGVRHEIDFHDFAYDPATP
jgi:hypothetical protein